jgi:hypothetical protein
MSTGSISTRSSFLRTRAGTIEKLDDFGGRFLR